MNQLKAISPIIAIIIILLITIAIAGAGYSYISAYWAGMTGRQIEVINALCVQTGSQGKVMVKNIGTSPLDTGEIAVINPLTGEDITGDVLWAGRVSDPGLVLQLRFEEGSGTLARDTSGKGNDGTLEGDTAWVEGKVGKALSFDGVDDYVDVSLSSSLDADYFKNPIWSIGMWVKPTLTGDADQDIFSGTTYDPRIFFLSGGNLYFSAYIGSHTNILSEAGALQADTWTHVVVTSNGINYILYVDGENADSTGWQEIDGGATDFRFGWSGWSGRRYKGLIDEVRVYDRALSPDEVKALYENSVLVQPGETATMTHTCPGRCRYSLVLGGMAKEAMLQC